MRERSRGLPSLNEARAERRRAIVFGRVALRAMPPQFWLWALTGMAAFGVIYWRISAGRLESRKSEVLAKQRAIAVALGPKIVPFRDEVERWVRELGASVYAGDSKRGAGALASLREAPGIYLRLRQANSQDKKQIRKAVQRSLLDGFTACLFVRPSAPTSRGAKCRVTADCLPGELCSEFATCASPPRPYNMRLAYRSLRVLSPEWSDELHEADTELAVNAYDRDLDSVAKHDVPVAVELMTKARFFTLVLDEDPAGGLPEGTPEESPEERVQRVPHYARVGVWEVSTGTPVLRLRLEAAGTFVPVGERAETASDVRAALARQTNNCALALAVREKIEATTGDAKAETP